MRCPNDTASAFLLLLLSSATAPSQTLSPATRAPHIRVTAVGDSGPQGRGWMAYDPLRQEVIGALSTVGNHARYFDTWVWRDFRWQRREPVTSPAPRSWPAMSWDPATQSVVMVGGVNELENRVLQDMWRWDGYNWQRLPDPPFALMAAGMTGDPVRRRTLLFGGAPPYIGSPTPVGNTWEWDGVRWAQLQPTNRPSPRLFPGMHYDDARGQIILAGGSDFLVSFGETWTWTGTDWQFLTPDPLGYGGAMTKAPGGGLFLLGNPPVVWNGANWRPFAGGTTRIRPDTAAFSDRNGVVVAQGPDQTWTLGQPPHNDWRAASPQVVGSAPIDSVTYAGTRDHALGVGPGGATWSFVPGDGYRQLAPAGAVDWTWGRTSYGLAYHAALDKVVLFGGNSFLGGRTDLWLWDGSAWSEWRGTTTPNPTPFVSSMFYAPDRDRLIVLSDRWWEWSPLYGWQRGTDPPPRAFFGYNPTNGRILAFGPIRNGTRTTETWEWDGSQWLQRTPRHTPLERPRANLHYVPTLRGIVMVGHRYVGRVRASDWLWLWDGQDWAELSGSQSLGPAGQVGDFQFADQFSTFDLGRGQILLPSHTGYGRTLVLDTPSLSTSDPTAILGQAARFHVSLPGQPGHVAWLLFAESGRPGILLPRASAFDVRILPLSADLLFALSLQAGLAHVLDAHGAATWQLPVPRNSSLHNRHLHAAVMVLAPSGSVAATSNDVRMIFAQ